MGDNKTTPAEEEWVDPDDAPELIAEWFAGAVVGKPGESPEELARRADEAARRLRSPKAKDKE
ncbi:hypothetical protein [Caenispirillum salinarum]|uniref:hypothetical protein n=1 Tax=Caenispirillum salinarum TaxID=859058 RepID=UPI0038511265